MRKLITILLLSSALVGNAQFVGIKGFRFHKVVAGGGGSPVTVTMYDGKNGMVATTHNLIGITAGRLLVVSTNASWCAAADAVITSDPSLTWTKRSEAAAGCGNAEIWTAVSTGGDIDITVNWGSTYQTSVVYSVVNQETTLGGASANGVSQNAASVNISTTRASSILICSTIDWDGNAGTRTYRGTPTEAMFHNDPANGSGYHYYYAAPTVTSYTVGFTAPASIGAMNTAVLEIRGN